MRKIICTVLVLLSVGMLFACGNDKKGTGEKNELQTDANGNEIDEELETDASSNVSNEELETDASGDTSDDNTGTVVDNSALINDVYKYKNTYSVTNKVWWDAWTPSFTLNDGQTLEFEVALNGGNAGYYSLNAVFCTTPIYGDILPSYNDHADYMEYVVLRSDNAGWGYQYANTTYTGSDYINQGESYDYKMLWTNAHYDISISRDGNVIIYEYTITGGDGKVYDCAYKVNSSFNLDVGCYVFFTGDAGVSFTLGTEHTESTNIVDEVMYTEAKPLPSGKKYVLSAAKHYSYGGLGKGINLSSMSTYEYDNNGKILRLINEYPEYCLFGNFTSKHIYKTYEYRADGTLYKEISDSLGKVSNIKEYNSKEQLVYEIAYDAYLSYDFEYWYEYDEQGRVSKYTYDEKLMGSGYEMYTYDSTGYIRSNKYDDGIINYTFIDDFGNEYYSSTADSFTKNAQGKVTSICEQEFTTTFDYDSVGRLIKVTAPKYGEEYSYDSNGNVVNRISWYKDSDSEIKYDTHDYTYDTAGNLIKTVFKPNVDIVNNNTNERTSVNIYTYKIVDDK